MLTTWAHVSAAGPGSYSGLRVGISTGMAMALALVGYVFLVALTYAFTHVFSGRGAFVQIGALIGTIMVANVFVIIIPNQKKTVAALIAGGYEGVLRK